MDLCPTLSCVLYVIACPTTTRYGCATAGLALSTMIPCARAGDYGNTKLFFYEPSAQELVEHTDNYCVLTKQTQYIHLRVFKTSKHYPHGIRMALPRSLCVEIAHSVKANRRYFLFVQEKDNSKPYQNHKSFCNYLERQLKHVLRNADATPQLVRRAYITEAHARLRPALESGDAARVAVAKEKMALVAHCCAHEVSTHQKYRFDLDDGGMPELMEVEKITPLPVKAALEQSLLSLKRCESISDTCHG